MTKSIVEHGCQTILKGSDRFSVYKIFPFKLISLPNLIVSLEMKNVKKLALLTLPSSVAIVVMGTIGLCVMVAMGMFSSLIYQKSNEKINKNIIMKQVSPQIIRVFNHHTQKIHSRLVLEGNSYMHVQVKP